MLKIKKKQSSSVIQYNVNRLASWGRVMVGLVITSYGGMQPGI